MEKTLKLFVDEVHAKNIEAGFSVAIVADPKGLIQIHAELSFVIICYRGECEVTTDPADVLCMKKNRIFIHAGQGSVSKMAFSDDFKGHVLAMTEPFCHSVVTADKYAVNKYYSKPRIEIIDDRQCKQHYHFFEWVSLVLQKRAPMADEYARQILRISFAVFSDYNRKPLPSFSQRSDGLSAQFFEILDGNDHFPLKQSEYARLLNVSVRTLQKAVVNATGLSPFDHIRTRRVALAKELIMRMDHNDTLTSIAERVGFTTEQAFSRFFRANVGMTVMEFLNCSRAKGRN